MLFIYVSKTLEVLANATYNALCDVQDKENYAFQNQFALDSLLASQSGVCIVILLRVSQTKLSVP